MDIRLPALDHRDPATGVLGGLLAAMLLAAFPVLGPALLAVAAVAVIEWVRGRVDAELLKGLGVGALVGLAAAKGVLETTGLPFAYLDGAWRSGAFFAAVPLVLALGHAKLPVGHARAGAATVLALVAGAAAATIG
jgi:hypothetical protein